jgi:hypothetical protein
MNSARSRLSKLLIGIVTAWVMTLLTRTTGGVSGGSAPERTTYTRSHSRQSAYANLRPQHGEPLRDGWSRPAPERIPHPTYWPMIFGLGIAFFMWGLISNLFVLGLGFTLLVIGIVGWVADLLTEFQD